MHKTVIYGGNHATRATGGIDPLYVFGEDLHVQRKNKSRFSPQIN